MTEKIINTLLEMLYRRVLSAGGFSANPGQGYRPDATAWAILAFEAAGIRNQTINLARSRLMKDQLPDGRVSLSPDHPEVIWPTPLAVLAWQGSDNYLQAQRLAINFILKITGQLRSFQIWLPFVRYKEVKGWPWVEKTFSWTVPTALSIIALKKTGNGKHKRVQDGIAMLLDRQLPKGGWNFGNTIIFDQELFPMPDTTGIALTALSGEVPQNQINKSIEYLKNEVRQIRTPLSLGWALLGLSAWGERLAKSQDWILETLKKQQVLGDYDTSSLSLLLIAFLSKKGREWGVL